MTTAKHHLATPALGIHRVDGFTSVTDEAARALVNVAAVAVAGNPGVNGIILQTGGLYPGRYIAIATGAGLDKWRRIDFVPLPGIGEIASPSGNGATLKVNQQYLVAATQIGDPGHVVRKLPDSTTLGPDGGTVTMEIIVFGAETFELQTQGTDVVLGMGADASTTSWRFQGAARGIRAVMIGDVGLGFPIWFLIPDGTFNETLQPRWCVAKFAQSEALPPYTTSGAMFGFDETLTATANGQLTLDNSGLSLNDKVLLHLEGGSINGLYDVEDPGDLSNPFVLRRSTDFAVSIDTAAERVLTFVRHGDRYEETIWALTPGPAVSATQINPDDYSGKIRATSYMTVRPLPDFTASGAGEELILTGDANGALTIDGNALSVNNLVLVAHEVGTDRQYHGLYRVQDIGDGSNPYVLRVDRAWASAGADDRGNLTYLTNAFGGTGRNRAVLVSFDGAWGVPQAERDAIKLVQPRVYYVKYATTAPLPLFNAVGSPSTPDLTLTGQSNGGLLVDDGIAVAVNDLVLVAAESGADRQYHGIYNVEATGDGSNPYVLRKWWNWATAFDTNHGAVVVVTNNIVNSVTGGRVYVWPDASPGDAADFRTVRMPNSQWVILTGAGPHPVLDGVTYAYDDSAGAGMVIEFPTAPSDGEEIQFREIAGSRNEITFDSGAYNMESPLVAEDFGLSKTVALAYVSFRYKFRASDGSWRVLSAKLDHGYGPPAQVVGTTTFAKAPIRDVRFDGSGTYTINMPASPADGDEFSIKETTASGAGVVTVSGNGNNIEITAGTMAANEAFSTSRVYRRWKFDGGVSEWILIGSVH